MTPLRWALVIVSFAAAIGASFYIMDSSWPVSASAVTVSPVTHLVLLTLALLELGARGAKVSLSAAALRIPITYRIALRASAGGDFGAAITPARTGAEPARFLIMTEAGMPSANILLVIFAELFLEAVSLALIALVMFIAFRHSGVMILGMVTLVVLYAASVFAIGALGYALSRPRESGGPPAWAARVGMHAGRWRRIEQSMRQLRSGIEGLRHVRPGMAAAAVMASCAHVALRLALLPVIVYSFHEPAPLAPLILWPIALTYGGVVAPVPAGGGAIEVAFKATLGHAIPANILGASLIWWRFYTFYIYVLIGALVAGGTVLRALRTDRDEPNAPPEPATASADALAAAAAAHAANPGAARR